VPRFHASGSRVNWASGSAGRQSRWLWAELASPAGRRVRATAQQLQWLELVDDFSMAALVMSARRARVGARLPFWSSSPITAPCLGLSATWPRPSPTDSPPSRPTWNRPARRPRVYGLPERPVASDPVRQPQRRLNRELRRKEPRSFAWSARARPATRRMGRGTPQFRPIGGIHELTESGAGLA
jgi:hypothetical protein